MNRLCVYCGSSTGANSAYVAAAKDLATLLVRHDIGLVYGGANSGIMGALADSMLAGGGRVIGDQLLTIAAGRLKSSLRPCDIIGRRGGDEFVALVPDVSSKMAGELAERLTRSLEQPYLIGKEKLVCSAAIGLALYPEHANTLTGLLRAAD